MSPIGDKGSQFHLEAAICACNAASCFGNSHSRIGFGDEELNEI